MKLMDSDLFKWSWSPLGRASERGMGLKGECALIFKAFAMQSD